LRGLTLKAYLIEVLEAATKAEEPPKGKPQTRR